MKVKYKYIALLLASFLLSVPSTVRGQEPERQQMLRKLAGEFTSEWQKERTEVEAYAEEKGIPIRRETEDGRTIILKRIENGQPLYEIDLNREGAVTSSVDEVYPGGDLGLSLTGAGETLGIWEVGDVPLASHQEFEDSGSQTRIRKQEDSGVDDHATHVAGTMIAAGVENDARGMAFEAELNAWDSGNDNGEMAAAAGTGLKVSNHSYGFLTGWHFDTSDNTWEWYGDPDVDSTEALGFGFYGDSARDWDRVAYNAPHYVIVKGAGNNRNDGPSNQPVPHRVNGDSLVTGVTRDLDGGQNGYDSVPRRGTAKNIITVGAVEGIPGGYSSLSDVQVADFSAWGPTDDGRIKPDLVAKGISVYSPTYDPSNPDSDNEYELKSGTSMASPMVSGSVGMLQEHYEDLHGGDMLLSSTIKALLVHTAEDANGNEGPDYRHGWGLMNVEQATNLVTKSAGAENLIREAELTENDTLEYQVYSSGFNSLRVTLSWTDPEGTPPDITVDPSDQMLVNDLDVRVKGPNGTEYQPFILDPSQPGNPAQSGDNTRDNVEQVLVADPVQGEYTVLTSHKGSLTDGPQSFSLITSGVVLESGVPDKVKLTAYPNPFRNLAIVEYALPKPKNVRLAMYDVLGRRVAVLENGRKDAGRHRVTLRSDRLSSGVYFGRLRAGTQTRTQKITVAR